MAFLIGLHILGAVVWVGGMFFAIAVLRPSVALLDPAPRLALLHACFRQFFHWVWAAILALFASGYAMIFAVLGGFGTVGVHVHLMHGLGLVMALLFIYLQAYPFRRMSEALRASDMPRAGLAVVHIRRIVAANLLLGLAVVLVGATGRYWAA